jgi:hypothetical protein
MNLKEMRAVVLGELEHIPRHPKPSQSDLRMLYFTKRMSSLGKKAEGPQTAGEVLRECIDQLAKDHPGAEFLFDREFFKRPGKKGRP